MKLKHTNQSGAAAIMFAMFMVIIISLLSIGFATLVRRDQRATLDKTLSNQAQYAAESAINKVQSDIASGAITASSTACNTPDLRPTFNLTGVSVSCLKWSLEVDSITWSPVDSTPVSTQIQPPGGAGPAVNSIKISWTPANAAATKYVGTPTSLNGFDSDKIPVIKLVLASSDLSAKSIVYLIPRDTGVLTVADAGQSGSFGYADCNTTPGTCVAGVNGLPGGTWNNGSKGWLSVQSLGGTSTVVAEAFAGNNLNGVKQQLIGSVADVDVTARSQDVIKRLKATVSLKPISWHPGFAAVSDSLCKNYQLDGTNNNAVGPVPSGTLCPN